ncbi:protein-L-isoaspartate carboxylmethyltransferase [Paenibacillus popilliae ATCC 14706]|uniref:Protein-L-isoaspartate carboxylmethyltransferase n=2 Tax=Paenibacillus popilliae TaxID=78057 RepID=M9M5S6_PAEPP|nr:protein-L-isoaspartate carboxylmethyltransferase [Paenibacillus popilliae ATCC 14706]
MFASVPAIYASPLIIDLDSEESVNGFTSAKPKVNLIYQSKAPGNGIYVRDSFHFMPDIIYSSLKSGEHKVARYVKLRQGEKVWIGSLYSKTLTDGSTSFGYSEDELEITSDKDGYYLVEYSAPNSDVGVKEYSIRTIVEITD